jgi:SAM-dependent methyltransferase
MNVERDMIRQYAGEAGRRYHDVVHGIPEQAYPWLARIRAAKFRPFIGSGDVVLEYGVGMGWNLAQIRCERRLGYDIADYLEPVLQRSGIEFVRDLNQVPDAFADVVICHHVLEHTANPPEVLKEIRRMLKVGSRLVLVVPYESGKKYHRYDPGEPNHHLYSWNVQTLGNLVERCGFQIVQATLKRYGYDRFAAVWADRLHMGESGFRLLRGLLQRMRPLSEVFVVAHRR